jgi:hypothetical protein
MFTPGEVAAALGVSVSRVHRAARSGLAGTSVDAAGPLRLDSGAWQSCAAVGGPLRVCRVSPGRLCWRWLRCPAGHLDSAQPCGRSGCRDQPDHRIPGSASFGGRRLCGATHGRDRRRARTGRAGLDSPLGIARVAGGPRRHRPLHPPEVWELRACLRRRGAGPCSWCGLRRPVVLRLADGRAVCGGCRQRHLPQVARAGCGSVGRHQLHTHDGALQCAACRRAAQPPCARCGTGGRRW